MVHGRKYRSHSCVVYIFVARPPHFARIVIHILRRPLRQKQHLELQNTLGNPDSPPHPTESVLISAMASPFKSVLKSIKKFFSGFVIEPARNGLDDDYNFPTGRRAGQYPGVMRTK